MNPYEPPRDLQRAPFWTRFRCAWNRALRVYREGLASDKISPAEHFRTWLSACLAGGIILIVVAYVAINIALHYLWQ